MMLEQSYSFRLILFVVAVACLPLSVSGYAIVPTAEHSSAGTIAADTAHERVRLNVIPAISGGAEYARRKSKERIFGKLMARPAPTVPRPSIPNAPPLITTIEGINFDEDGFNSSFYHIPPDPMGAAGSNHVVSVVNTSIEWHSKAGVQQNSQSLSSFFSSLSPLTNTFDPKVLYDQYAGRFIVVTLEVTDVSSGDPSNTSQIFLAVSDDSDPNGTWFRQAINSKIAINSVDHWADYPGFAVDEEAVYVTANMYTFGTTSTFGGSRLWIVNKSPFYSGGAAQVTVHNPSTAASLPGDAATMQPAHMFGTGPAGVGTFLVNTGWVDGNQNDFLSVIRVNTPLGTPTFTNTFIALGNITSGASLSGAPQLGSATKIETNDDRALNAVWRANALWATNTVLPLSGTDADQETAHWYKINTTNLAALTLLDQGNVGGEDIAAGARTFMPSVMVDASGNMAMGFSGSAPTIYPGAYFTGRLSSDPAGTVQSSGVLRSGLDFYIRRFGGTSNRWGDYSGISVDPTDEATFWVFNEYAITRGTPSQGEDGRWGTAFGSFTFIALPAVPTLASPLDGATAVSTSPTLAWNSTSGAASYGLQVSTSSLFTTTVVNQSGITGTSQQVSGLASNTTHYWRVNGTNAGGTSDWSSVRNFRTALSGDFNADDVVDVSDLVLFAGHFGLGSGDPGYEAPYDLNGDHTVDVSDLVIFASVFGTTSPSARMAGEPEKADTRSIGRVRLEVERVGEDRIKVTVMGEDFRDVRGYQFGLNYDRDRAVLEEVKAGEMVGDKGLFVDRKLEREILVAGGAFRDVILTGSGSLAIFLFGGKDLAEDDFAFVDGILLDKQRQYYYLVVEGNIIPKDYRLYENYPNPFNPSTQIKYWLGEDSQVHLVIYNVMGQEVRTLVNGEDQEAGFYTIQWDGRNDAGVAVTSGVYLYRMQASTPSRKAGVFKVIKKMTLVK